MINLNRLAAIATVVLSTTIAVEQAQAATFNFSSNPAALNQATRTFNNGDAGLTVTGTRSDGQSRSITQNLNGLGIAGTGGGELSTQTENGSLVTETLKFSFDRSVKLTKAIFSVFDGNDNLKLVVSGNTLFNNASVSAFSGQTLAANLGQTFEFSTLDATDNYRLLSIDYEKVPEPAFVLGLLGVSAIGFGLKRKRVQPV